CGKVVVAQNPEELTTLYELKKRGEKNAVNIEQLDEQQLADIEPNAKTCTHALYTPSTSVVDPTEVCKFLEKELRAKQVVFMLNTPYIKKVDAHTIIAGNHSI